MNLLSALYRRIVRGTDLDGVVPYDKLPPETQDEVFALAADLVRVENDVADFPPLSRERLRRRFVLNKGIDDHPYSRTIYWIAGHLRKEPKWLSLSSRR